MMVNLFKPKRIRDFVRFLILVAFSCLLLAHETSDTEKSNRASDTVTHTIILDEGWHLISFRIDPADRSVATVLNSIAGNYDFVKSFVNGIEVLYDASSPGTATLQELDPLHGYYIHMLAADTLTVTGTEIPADSTIALNAGINLVSFLSQQEMPGEDALASIAGQVIYVKAIDHDGVTHGQGADGGLSYDPALPEYSTLVKFQPNFGYWIKVSEAVNLSYPTEILQATETVGNQGGTIGTDDFILTIPAGAFDSDYELQLYVDYGGYDFGESGVSPVFRVDDLPAEWELPLEVSIAYNGTLAGESYIAVGGETTVDTWDSSYTDVGFSLYPAEEASGFLTCEIPVPQNIGRKSLKKRTFETFSSLMSAVTNGAQWLSQADHFMLRGVELQYYPDVLDELLVYLEEAYDRFKDLGFDYSKRTWPINVDAKWMSKGNAVFYYADGMVAEYDENTIFSSQRLAIEIAYMACIFPYYDLREENAWLLSAVSLWALYKFQYYTEWGVDKLKNGIKASFDGFPHTNTTDATIRGASFFFEYLVNRYGGAILGQIFEDTEDWLHAVEAIVQNTADPLEWLADYYTYLMTDSTLSTWLGDFWQTNMHDQCTISDATVTVTLTDTYYDISGKWYRIDLSSDLQPDNDLKFTVDGQGAVLNLFKFNNGEITGAGSTDGEYTISDIKDFADDGYDLFALVTNNRYASPYTDVSTITLEIELIKPGLLGTARMEFVCSADVTVQYADGRTENKTFGKEFISYWEINVGTWDESRTIFTSVWDNGSLVVQLNEDRNMITYFQKTWSHTFQTEYERGTDIGSVTGGDIPGSPFTLLYSLNGADVGNGITSIEWERYEWRSEENHETTTLTGFSFPGNSRFFCQLGEQ